MYMTDFEILRDYKEAKRKDEQIQILADRNLVSKQEMARWLFDHDAPVNRKLLKKADVTERTPADDGTSEPEPVLVSVDPVARKTASVEPPEPDASQLLEVPEGLTKDEAYSIANLIDFSLFDFIRNDPDIDSLEWLRNVIHAYEKLCLFSGYVGYTEHDKNEVEE